MQPVSLGMPLWSPDSLFTGPQEADGTVPDGRPGSALLEEEARSEESACVERELADAVSPKRPARALLWGRSVDLEERFDDDPASARLLTDLSWEFTLLGLADKTELPVPLPDGSARLVGLRLYLDTLHELNEEGVLDAPGRRFLHGLRRFWEIHRQSSPARAEEIVTWLREAPVEEGIRSPLVCLFWITGTHFSHYQGISLRYRDDEHFDVVLVDLSPPGAHSEFLGQREAASYLFRRVNEQDLVSYLRSPLGKALLSHENFSYTDVYQVTHRMDFYLGSPHAICYPWALQQLQWSASCCPKSLSALLRNEYTLLGDPAEAISNLYCYKKLKGRVSRSLMRFAEELAGTFPQHLSGADAVLPILRERVEMRCRYEPLQEEILQLKMSPEAEHLAVLRTIKAVAAVLGQSKQLPRPGSPESWERYITLRAPIAQATLRNLTHVLANLAVSHRTQDLATSVARPLACTVAAAVVHWADRMIRPVDEGVKGSMADLPADARCMLDLRSRICYSATKHLQEVPNSDRQTLKRFFRVLADPRWSKAPSRPLSRMGTGESPPGFMTESEWASMTPLPGSSSLPAPVGSSS